LAALWQTQFRRIAGMCIGFLPVFGMALHNWVYGGVFVLFTTTSALAQSMPPSAYLSAFHELLRFDFAGENIWQALRQLGAWLAGPSELVLMAPLHVVALIIVVRVALRRGFDPWLRLTACASLAQQCVNLFFLTYGRYYYLTWLLTLLVVAVWLHDEGFALQRRWFPITAKRVASLAQRPAWMAVSRALDRLTLPWEGSAIRDSAKRATL
jgi:hypothetical protein